jgi:hypothetical protein
MKKSLSRKEMIRVIDATEHEATKLDGGRAEAAVHPHVHLGLRDSPDEIILARQLGYPSIVAFRARYAFGQAQLTHLRVTFDDLEAEFQPEADFLARLAHLPPTLTRVTVAGEVCGIRLIKERGESTMRRYPNSEGDQAPKCGSVRLQLSHLGALCSHWLASVQSIEFEESPRGRFRAPFQLTDWRLPPGMTDLRTNTTYFYATREKVHLPPMLRRVDTDEWQDHDLNMQPRSDRPPARSAADQAVARAERLAKEATYVFVMREAKALLVRTA